MDTTTETRVLDFDNLPECAWQQDVPGPHEGCREFTGGETIPCGEPATVVVDVTELVYDDGVDRVAFCRTHADIVLTDQVRDPTYSATEVHDAEVQW